MKQYIIGNEMMQRCYDLYLIHDDYYVVSDITKISVGRLYKIINKMHNKHLAAVKKLHEQQYYIIRNQEILERYFYNPKYKLNGYKEPVSHW